MLFQLTGDRRWLAPPYVPARTRGFEPLDDGGLPENIQAEIRAAAEAALSGWLDGKPATVPTPDDADMVELMSTCLGERVPAEFAPMVAEHLGFRPFRPDDASDALHRNRPDFKVAVIGAGVSGIAAAVSLKHANIPFVILEKNDEVGGTWWENRYPGARVDIPSDLYSFSFAPKVWSEHFSQRDELSSYLIDAVARFGIREDISFFTEVQTMHWDSAANKWQLRTLKIDGSVEILKFDAVITATGLHNRPKRPMIPGEETFRGQIVHSAQWPADVTLQDKRVAVVGTGASAMQVVNSIAKQVKSLTIVQRTPHWIAPNENYFKKTSQAAQYLLAHVPFYRQWHRFRLYWLYTERLFAALLVDPKWDNGGKSVSKVNEVYRDFLTKYLTENLKDREDLQKKSLPDYPPFGKRILLDNGWFKTLKRPNVDLLTGDVVALKDHSLVTSGGEEREIDLLILCTGFEQQRFLHPMQVYGRGGKDLRAMWEDDNARAYLGITCPLFPNLFFLYGPNTNPGSGSYINTAEAQVRYIVRMLSMMLDKRLTSVECREEPYEQYNRKLDEANTRMVYAQRNVNSYYRNARGRVVTNSPWTMLRYWNLTARPNPDDYTLTTEQA